MPRLPDTSDVSRPDPSSTAARYERIWRVIEAIPVGSVASYGQVAELAGIARGARQVARSLRHVPDGRSVPWFRVLRADGRIAMAKSTAGYRRQRTHLLSEGVVVNDGRVSMRVYRWAPRSDEILLRF
ncbi:MAG: MGMT family protein [Pseudomonadota bacterium]